MRLCLSVCGSIIISLHKTWCCDSTAQATQQQDYLFFANIHQHSSAMQTVLMTMLWKSAGRRVILKSGQNWRTPFVIRYYSLASILWLCLYGFMKLTIARNELHTLRCSVVNETRLFNWQIKQILSAHSELVTVTSLQCSVSITYVWQLSTAKVPWHALYGYALKMQLWTHCGNEIRWAAHTL